MQLREFIKETIAEVSIAIVESQSELKQLQTVL